MSNVDRPEVGPKPEPFLSLNLIEGDAGTSVSCNELNVAYHTGPGKKAVCMQCIQPLIASHAATLLNRFENGTAPENTTENQIQTARKVVEAKEKGLSIADLIKPL